MEPESGWLTADELAQLAAALGCDVRQVLAICRSQHTVPPNTSGLPRLAVVACAGFGNSPAGRRGSDARVPHVVVCTAPPREADPPRWRRLLCLFGHEIENWLKLAVPGVPPCAVENIPASSVLFAPVSVAVPTVVQVVPLAE